MSKLTARDADAILERFEQPLDNETAGGMERIAADEEAFEGLVALFRWAHGRAPHENCEAYQWGTLLHHDTLIALGFEDRAGFQHNYDLCLMIEHGPRAKDALN
jgi:hypothetical protein